MMDRELNFNLNTAPSINSACTKIRVELRKTGAGGRSYNVAAQYLEAPTSTDGK